MCYIYYISSARNTCHFSISPTVLLLLSLARADDVDVETDDVEICDINTSVCVTGPGKGRSLASAVLLPPPAVTASTNQVVHGGAAATTTTMTSAVVATSRRVSVKAMALMSSAAAEHATNTTIAPSSSSSSDDALTSSSASSGSPSVLHHVLASAVATDHQMTTNTLPTMMGDNTNMEGAGVATLGVFQPRKHLVRTPPKPTPALAPEATHTDPSGAASTSSLSVDIPEVVGVEDTLSADVAGGEAALSPVLSGEGGAAATATTTPAGVQTPPVLPTAEDAEGLDAVDRQVAAACEEPSRSPPAVGSDAASDEEQQLALWSAAELETVSRAIGRVSMGMSGERASDGSYKSTSFSNPTYHPRCPTQPAPRVRRPSRSCSSCRPSWPASAQRCSPSVSTSRRSCSAPPQACSHWP